MKTIHPVNTAISLLVASILSMGLTACSGGSSTPASQQPVGLSNFQSAEVVIGQADFTGSGVNQGSVNVVNANTLSFPNGNPAISSTGVLYVPDSGNHRLLGFNSIPTVNNQVADFVIGQPDFSTAVAGVSATKISGPQQVIIENGQMFLADYDNDRILIWNSIPATDGVAADVVLGQADFVSNLAGCAADSFDTLESVTVKGDKIIATDSGNNRVLIWNNSLTTPVTSGAPADIVLGQQSFTNCEPNDTDDNGVTDVASASTMYSPAGVWTDGRRLVVLDSGNSRALIWNDFPTSHFTAADVVLGQSDFTHITNNDDDQNDTDDGVASARTLNWPYLGVYSDDVRLFVIDGSNNRLLVWNTFPTVNFTPADVVLGQSDFTGTAANAGGSASSRTLSLPGGVFQSGNKLIVTDSGNSRYLIFNDPQ